MPTRWKQILLTLAVVFGSECSARANGIETIVLSDDPAPQIGPGVRFREFNTSVGLPEAGTPFPILNDGGAVVFAAEVRGPGILNADSHTFWILDAAGALELIARARIPSPGLPVGVFDLGSTLFLNEVGEVAFSPIVERSDSSPTTFVRGTDGTLRTVVRPGDPAPSPPGATFERLFPIGLSDDSELAFIGALEVGPGGVTRFDDTGIWGPNGVGGLLELQRRQTPVPGEPAGTSFSRSIVSRAVQNREGEVAFKASLELEDGIPGRANLSLFGPTETGETRIRVRQGDSAPGGPEGATFFNFPGLTTLNEAGQLAFRASMEDVSPFSDDGIWGPGPDAGVTLLAREGDQAPGAPEGVTYVTFNDPTLSGQGGVAFLCQLRPTGSGVFGPDLTGRPVMRFMEGDLLEGSIRGPIEGLQPPVLNDRHQLVAVARLGSPSGNTAILYANPTGDRGILVQADQAIEVRPGDVRIVSRVSGVLRVTRSGGLVFRIAFTDGTNGLFRATVPDFIKSVRVDVRPRVERNLLVPGSRGWVPVALLGSAEFDVLTVDLEALRFGPAGALPRHPRDGAVEDVDGDGWSDLLTRYRSDETGLVRGDSEACLSGTTADGLGFEGCDTVILGPTTPALPRGLLR